MIDIFTVCGGLFPTKISYCVENNLLIVPQPAGITRNIWYSTHALQTAIYKLTITKPSAYKRGLKENQRNYNSRRAITEACKALTTERYVRSSTCPEGFIHMNTKITGSGISSPRTRIKPSKSKIFKSEYRRRWKYQKR